MRGPHAWGGFQAPGVKGGGTSGAAMALAAGTAWWLSNRKKKSEELGSTIFLLFLVNTGRQGGEGGQRCMGRGYSFRGPRPWLRRASSEEEFGGGGALSKGAACWEKHSTLTHNGWGNWGANVAGRRRAWEARKTPISPLKAGFHGVPRPGGGARWRRNSSSGPAFFAPWGIQIGCSKPHKRPTSEPRRGAEGGAIATAGLPRGHGPAFRLRSSARAEFPWWL